MVFHSPQASQRPDQRVCVALQAEQEKVVVFAMAPLVPEDGRFFKPLRAFLTAGGAPRPQALRAIGCGGR
jgi:hypothetical protein